MSRGGKSKIYVKQILDLLCLSGAKLPWSSAPAFLFSLHYGNPEDANGNLANECIYLGYSAVRLARNESEWIILEGLISNRHEVRFAQLPKKSDLIITHWALTPEGFGYPVFVDRFSNPICAPEGKTYDPSTIKFPPGSFAITET